MKINGLAVKLANNITLKSSVALYLSPYQNADIGIVLNK